MINEDEGKVDYKKTVIDGVERESYKTPDGRTVESAKTLSHNEQSKLAGMKQGIGHDIPASQSGFGNTTGGDVPPMNSRDGTGPHGRGLGPGGGAGCNTVPPINTPLGEMLHVMGGYKPGQNPMQQMNLQHLQAPKRMKVGGENLDILTVRDV